MPDSRCRFEYLYRDAGNYKGRGHVLLLGTATPDNEEAIRAALIDRLWFVAEEVGLPTLYHLVREGGEADPGLDHGWHEFVGLGEVGEGDGEPIMTMKMMIEILRKAR
ncbi:MAG: hypothetical protein ABIS00_03760 [Gemmatimonadales bacterium]